MTVEARRLVLVEWHDSRRPLDTWSYLDDLSDFSVVVCRSVGWLVHDGEDVKAIAPNMGDVGADREQAVGTIQIPTRCIVSMRNLLVEAT